MLLVIHAPIPDVNPDSKVHGANMGSIWGRQGPGGPYVGPWILLFGYVCKKLPGAPFTNMDDL